MVLLSSTSAKFRYIYIMVVCKIGIYNTGAWVQENDYEIIIC